MLKKLTVYFVLITQLFSSSLAYGTNGKDVAACTGDQMSSKIQDINNFYDFISLLRSGIDRKQFELDALLDSLDYDHEKVIEFVENEIVFEPYVGLLRGAQGTLVSRAGNSLDQSVLLASLLKDTGEEARIVKTTLTQEAAEELLRETSLNERQELPAFDLKTLSESVRSLGAATGESEEVIATLLEQLKTRPPENSNVATIMPEHAEAEAEADRLLEILETNSIGFTNAADGIEQIISEARDYFWVQTRTSSSDKWRNVHPISSSEPQWTINLSAESYFADSIPEELQHRVRFEVFLDQKFGDKVESHPLMSPWERPSSTLLGRTITYANLPMQLLGTNPELDVATAVAESRLFLPLFDGKIPSGAQAFDLNGNVLPPEAAATAAASIFQELFSKTERAASALNGLTENTERIDGDLVSIRSHHAKFTLIGPGGVEKQIIRRYLDRESGHFYDGSTIPADNTMQTVINQRLAEEMSFAIAVGHYPKSFILDKYFERIEASKPLMNKLASTQNVAMLETALINSEGAQLYWDGHLDLFSLFDMAPRQSSNSKRFLAEPSIVAHRRSYASEKNLEVTDIINNQARYLFTDEGKLSIDPKAALRNGVWETWAEQIGTRVVQKVVASSAGSLVNVGKRSEQPRVLAPSQFDVASKLDMPLISRAAIQRDLNNGYHVVLPAGAGSDGQAIAWYRVSTISGETLGMAGSGMGANAAEYAIKLTAVAIGGVVAAVVWYDCNGGWTPSSSGGKALGCGICALLAGAVAGVVAYGMIGSYSITAAYVEGGTLARLVAHAHMLNRAGLPIHLIKGNLVRIGIASACIGLDIVDG